LVGWYIKKENSENKETPQKNKLNFISSGLLLLKGKNV
jgi:hypothetical protein